jgi:hypothetical protein
MYTIVSDEDGHNYIIPVDKKEDWIRFTNSEEYDFGYLPSYAVSIPGCLSFLTFDNYQIN